MQRWIAASLAALCLMSAGGCGTEPEAPGPVDNPTRRALVPGPWTDRPDTAQPPSFGEADGAPAGPERPGGVRRHRTAPGSADYEQMLRNGRVHDTDGDLSDGENSVSSLW